MTNKEKLLRIIQVSSSNNNTIDVFNSLNETEIERVNDYCQKMTTVNIEEVNILELNKDKNNYITITIRAKTVLGQ